MNTAYKNLLNNRLKELSNKDFDLEVWKSGTALVLNRVFGKENSYSREIEALRVDFSSWSLRDATADSNPRETCKRRGREILEVALAELQLPSDNNKIKDEIINSLDDGSGKLSVALEKKDTKAVREILNKVKKANLTELLARVLAD